MFSGGTKCTVYIWAYQSIESGLCAMQTLAVAVYNHYMRIAHEEQRRKTAQEKQVAADAAARIRDAAATDDATAAAAAMTSEQRPGPPAAHGDVSPGRRAQAANQYPTAIGVPTHGPLEAWG